MEFNTNQKYALLSKMGYSGPSEGPAMEEFIQSNPGIAARMGKFTRALQKKVGMAEGGSVTGGYTIRKTSQGNWQIINPSGVQVAGFDRQQEAAARAELARLNGTAAGGTGTNTNAGGTGNDTTAGGTGADTVTGGNLSPGEELSQTIIQTPQSLVDKAEVDNIDVTKDTLIPGNTGQVSGKGLKATTTTASNVSEAKPVKSAKAQTMTPVSSAGDVKKATKTIEAAQSKVSTKDLVTAAQQNKSSISNMKAEQGTAYLMDNPVQREVERGELVSGSAVDAAKVNKLTQNIQAATATPSQKATVQGQLTNLMKDFEGGKTPAWAAGAMRNAQAILEQRGLGASSLAGQAVIQAAMESALPIAQADASTFAQFEAQNLSNRQQTALFAAQMRADFLKQDFDQKFQTRVLNAAKISDIANMNFTAEQNIALENSRAVNTMKLANLDARQAMTMAQAAALSNLDMANLNNRQQAAVQNAQAFLQMDLTNLSNEQQVEMFRAQSNIQALFTDQAAKNAARQFNASSENQTNQFFADLASRVSMFNSEQSNAMKQFNAGEKNVTSRFNSQMEAQRRQFNATNSLTIAQANAQWRQNVQTLNTAAQNNANMEYARTSNALTAKALDEIWQKERDTMSFAFTAYQSDQDRAAEFLLADKRDQLTKWQESKAEESAKWSFLFKTIFGGY